MTLAATDVRPHFKQKHLVRFTSLGRSQSTQAIEIIQKIGFASCSDICLNRMNIWPREFEALLNQAAPKLITLRLIGVDRAGTGLVRNCIGCHRTRRLPDVPFDGV